MKYKLQAYSIWEYGQRKDANGNPHQEDSIFPAYGKQQPTDRLFILCDGMGGHDAGEVASATVCEAMSQSVLSHNDVDAHFTDGVLQQAVNAAFDALDKKDTGAAKKMGTTMTFLKLHDNGATIAHMGDSRVYHIRQGADKDSTQILFETHDHSLVNDMIKVGELTPEEAKHSRQKNVITRAMQPNLEVRPKADVYHTVDIKPGDYFFMCSDGMLEEMDDDNIRYFFSKAAGTDEERVEQLRQSTQYNRDNHSAIIVHILDVEGSAQLPPQKAKAPQEGKPTETVKANVGLVTDDAPSVQGAEGGGKAPKKNSTFLMIAVAIVVIIVAAFTIYHFMASKPEASQKETTEKITKPGRKAPVGKKVKAQRKSVSSTPTAETATPQQSATPQRQQAEQQQAEQPQSASSHNNHQAAQTSQHSHDIPVINPGKHESQGVVSSDQDKLREETKKSK